MTPSEWIPFLEQAADLADEIALERFRANDLHVESKPDTSLVTEADLKIEEEVRKLVAAHHPDLGVFGEEQGQQEGRSDTRLIVDPIDATANFARGIPVFATLLAIEEGEEVVAGLVSAPALGTRWCAVRGAGARRMALGRNEEIRVSGMRTLADAQVFHGSLGGYEAVKTPPGVASLGRHSRRDRGFGDFYQHVLVAEGSGEIAVDPIVSPWDIAALQVIVEEAGGRATTLDGERSIRGGSLVSTNGHLHDEALRIINGA